MSLSFMSMARGVLQDFRYAGRMMRKAPGFTAVVIATIALGVGANTAVFSVIQAVLSPMQIREADRVVMVWSENPKRGWHRFPASGPDFLDWKASGVFSGLAAVREDGFNLRVGDQTERIEGLAVTGDFFDVLASTTQIGRPFAETDMLAGRNDVALLSDRLWQSRFGRDPAIVGKVVVINGAPHTVAGVVAKRFPRFGHEDLYVPLVMGPPLATNRGSRSVMVIGKLDPAVTLAAAQQRMSDLSAQIARSFPQSNTDTSVALQPVEEAFVQDARTLLVVLFGAVGFVLLVACANIASLMLARGTSRHQEMAVRVAVGGSRWRLTRQLLTESVALALVGGAAAVGPALWGLRLVASYKLDELPNADLMTLDTGVLLFNFLLAAATGIVCGLVPSWLFWRSDVHTTLKASKVSGHQWIRGGFVVAQLAFTLVLLVGAGLMLHTVLKLRNTSPGYRADGVLTARIALSDRQYASMDDQRALFGRLAARARRLPGVQSASAIDELPTSTNLHGSGLISADRPEPRPEDIPLVLTSVVVHDYFRVMRVPLVRGRYLTERDDKAAPMVALVDEWTARSQWPGQDPIGKRIRLGRQQPWREIVGVVGAIEQPVVVKVLKGQVGQVYLPLEQAADARPAMSFVLRTDGDPAALISSMRAALRELDPEQPLFQPQTMTAARAAGRASAELATELLAGFAVIALLLSTLGLYGLVSYSVSQRTREFGIRLSLGAQPLGVIGLVFRQGLVLIGIGLTVGLLTALALTRAMSSLLFGVEATDPLTFAVVTGVLATVGLLATFVPARRAMKVNPAIALRLE